MTWLAALPVIGKVFGAGGPITKILDGLDADNRREFEQAMAQVAAETQVQIEQSKINQEAAKHPSVFVAGWRSFIGWVCGCAVCFHYFGVASIIEHYTGVPVVVHDLTDLWPLMLGLLGIGGMRTLEKFKGVHRNSL